MSTFDQIKVGMAVHKGLFELRHLGASPQEVRDFVESTLSEYSHCAECGLLCTDSAIPNHKKHAGHEFLFSV
jgi:hypothetical protein